MSVPIPSFTHIVSALFFAWILHSLYTIYTIYTPKACDPSKDVCLESSFKSDDTFMLMLGTSLDEHPLASQVSTIWAEEVRLSEFKSINLEVKLPRRVINNGSMYMHVVLTSVKFEREINRNVIQSKNAYHTSGPLTKYVPKQAEAYNLLNSDKKDAKSIPQGKPVTHWKPKVVLSVVSEPLSLSTAAIPGEIARYLKLNTRRQYLPIAYLSDAKVRVKNLWPVNKTHDTLPLQVEYEPTTLGKFRFMLIVEGSLQSMHGLGFSEYDTDDVKGIFFDTSIYLLLLTILVTSCHVLFDFLAFKSDIQFWRNRKTMEGLSMSTLVWRCVSQFIITLYLFDQQTSLLVLVPAAIGTVIEVWKIKKALKVNIVGFKFEMASRSEKEKETDAYDSKFMKYLSQYVLYPLVILGSIYSLLYNPHKSWYSWVIQSAANGVYAFGFLFMLPQLFINYKLKSVAHLPWRAFMYKAFNTFIDDLFAFILTSIPTAHRVAAFRDDVVFLIYLYQRWLYPVDKTRVNEFGETAEEEKKTN